jgi:hypothetical protein
MFDSGVMAGISGGLISIVVIFYFFGKRIRRATVMKTCCMIDDGSILWEKGLYTRVHGVYVHGGDNLHKVG